MPFNIPFIQVSIRIVFTALTEPEHKSQLIHNRQIHASVFHQHHNAASDNKKNKNDAKRSTSSKKIDENVNQPTDNGCDDRSTQFVFSISIEYFGMGFQTTWD